MNLSKYEKEVIVVALEYQISRIMLFPNEIFSNAERDALINERKLIIKKMKEEE